MSMEVHKQKVSKLAGRVKSFYAKNKPFWIYHGSTNCTRQKTFDPSQIVDTSALNNIIEIDVESQLATCEPNVPMDVLVHATLKHGLIPAVVPEFPGITVGGGFSGTAGESSSFKFGYLDRTIISIEIVLANGDVTTASPHGENADLFNGAAGALGTLGVLTLLEIRLIPAKKYVCLTYLPVTTTRDAIDLLQACVDEKENPYDFVDGIQFSRARGVVCVGRLSDEATDPIQTFTTAWDPWFYKHARAMASKSIRSAPISDSIPLTDYLFRYDRGAFWMGDYYPLFLTDVMNNAYSRWLCDSFLRTRFLFQSMHLSNRSQRFIIQDLQLPAETAEDFLNYVDRDFGIYPLWLCPLQPSPSVIMQRLPPKQPQTSKSLLPTLTQNPMSSTSPSQPSTSSSSSSSSLILNVGLWGPGPTHFPTFVHKNRLLESTLYSLGGLKWLYAHTYYTETEFWDIYNREDYETLRQKYHAMTLPSIYTKVKSTEVSAGKRDWRATVWGLWGFFKGEQVEYLLAADKEVGGAIG